MAFQQTVAGALSDIELVWHQARKAREVNTPSLTFAAIMTTITCVTVVQLRRYWNVWVVSTRETADAEVRFVADVTMTLIE